MAGALQVGEVKVHIQGDIGGAGISRWRFTRNDATFLTPADAQAAGTAIRAFYNSSNSFPTGVSAQVDAAVEFFDLATALVGGTLTMTAPPAAVVGAIGGNYGAGLGVRVNWKTTQTLGRRLMRGATFMVPYASAAFSASGAVNSTVIGNMITAGNAYITAMLAANLEPVVWHRPLKGTTTGGIVGNINAVAVSAQPCGLRSRRR